MHEQTTTKRVNVISLSLKGYFEIEIVVFHTLYTHTLHTLTHMQPLTCRQVEEQTIRQRSALLQFPQTPQVLSLRRFQEGLC